jgi:CDP-glycerol glycerophosphotransferase (TagB/SpsB family)
VLELSGWAYHVGWPDDADVRILVSAAGGRSAEFEVIREPSEVVNTVAGDAARDHSGAAFRARLAATELIRSERAGATFDHTWSVHVVLDREGRSDRASFSRRFRWGSAGQLGAQQVDGCLVRPNWEANGRLTLTTARRAVSAGPIELAGESARLRLRMIGDLQPIRAVLQNDAGEEREVPLSADGQNYSIHVDSASLLSSDASDDDVRRERWYLSVLDDRAARRVHWSGEGSRGLVQAYPAEPRCSVRNAPSGVVRFDVGPPRPLLDDVELVRTEPAALKIRGRYDGDHNALANLTLDSGRAAVPVTDLESSGREFAAVFPLVHRERWATTERPLRSGAYRVRIAADVAAEPSQDLLDRLPDVIWTPAHQLQLETDPGGCLHIRVGAPRPFGETGAYARRQLRLRYQRTTSSAPATAAYFESWAGKSAFDQTRAVHDELVRRDPKLTRYWGVADCFVEVPDGAVPILIHTAEWWNVLATSRFLVTNYWMSGAFRRRPYQCVQQTWHGTPYKAMGLDRIGSGQRPGYAAKVKLEVDQWSQLIAQNHYSAEIFATAYGFENQVLEIGYPRNDVLTLPADADVLRTLRAKIGLRPDELAILYLPTWREDNKVVYRALDFDRLLAGLGADARLLVRGHANTVLHDSTLEHAGLIDLTLYPDVNDLYLVADVLITDYSSAMFDYSVTGKPVIFFAPDLDRYAGELRGAYFSLPDCAPGPVLETTDQVIDALRDLDRVRVSYAERYAAWQQKFNYLDDGHAAERAVDALLADAG